jgi:phage-related baseplate assembly protein
MPRYAGHFAFYNKFLEPYFFKLGCGADVAPVPASVVPNKVTIILDPQPFLSTAQNIDETAGGTNSESDPELRERIYLAPSTFSVAGPKRAYEFFAKSAHPGIVDVAITSPVPGEVHIFPLMENGGMPDTEILDAVFAICNGDKIRPLTDTVIVAAPSIVNYSITVNLTLLTDAVDSEVLQQVTEALNGYKKARESKLGLDVVKNQINALCMLPGKVYNAVVVQPVADIVAAPEVYANCTGITVNLVGTSDE